MWKFSARYLCTTDGERKRLIPPASTRTLSAIALTRGTPSGIDVRSTVFSSAAAIWSICACACSTDTPGFSRAIVPLPRSAPAGRADAFV
jgi:hypothetical protein